MQEKRWITVMLLVVLFFYQFCMPRVGYSEGNTPGLNMEDDPLLQKTLRVAFEPNLPPFQFEKNGQYVGFNIDLMNKIARDQGFLINYLPMPEDKSIQALQNGEIDLILGIHFTADLNELMEFTERYLTSSVGVLVPLFARDPKRNRLMKRRPEDEYEPENFTDLQDSIVSIQKSTLEYDFLRNVRNIHYHVTSNQPNALRLLLMDRADAFVGNRVTAEYLLNSEGVADQYQFMDSYLLPLEYSLAVQKGNYSLLHTLNVGIRNTKIDGSYAKLYSKWFADFETPISAQLKKIIQVISLLLALAVLIFLLGLRWNRQLRQEVERKTLDLKTMNSSLEFQMQHARNSDQFKEQILESSVRGILTCDLTGVITSVNSVAVKTLGLNKKPLHESVQQIPILWEMLQGKMPMVLQRNKQFVGEEIKARKNGEEFYLRYNILPLFDFERKIMGLFISFEDFTEEKKLREQVNEQEKSRALVQLVAGVAHEIRNPLTSIKTFVELIPYKIHNDKFQREISTHVPKEIERLNQLVEGLIHYAKPKSKQKKLIEVHHLIQSVVVLLERTLKNKGFTLEVKLEGNLWIEVDESQLKQVLINLILNALEAMENKRNELATSIPLKLVISAYATREEVWIKIQDEGKGMTTEELKKVFEPFYTTKSTGTGLGLALTMQYITENDGIIEVDSRVGEGTTMQICFKKREKKDG